MISISAHFLNPITNLCECKISPRVRDIVKCTEKGMKLRIGFCMTYEEQERTIHIASCIFDDNFSTKFNENGHYIQLPVKNASELNDYMCGPMNQKGRLCSECIKGLWTIYHFMSSGLVCSDCTGTWYGVPLYLFLEFVPITIVLVAILFFRENI